MADVAALTGDTGYVQAIDALWENVVGKKLHLNGGKVLDKAVAADAVFSSATVNVLGNVYPALTVPAQTVKRDGEGCTTEPATLTLIPYFAWCHRGAGELQTFFPTRADPALFPADGGGR